MKSIIIGTAGTSPDETFGITRNNPDGTLDTTFNSTVTVITDIGGNSAIYGLALIPSGGSYLILAVGQNVVSSVVVGGEAVHGRRPQTPVTAIATVIATERIR